MLDLARYAPLIGIGGLLLALALYSYLLRQPTGNDRSRLMARLIEEGAMAFLRRQYAVLLPVLLVVAALLTWAVGWRIGAAFVFGGLASVLAGFLGMRAATKTNVRTTEAARGRDRTHALQVAFGGGAVMGLAVASAIAGSPRRSSGSPP